MIVTDGGKRGTKATWCTGLSFYDLERAGRPRRVCRSNSGAGALGFRDFPGLLAAKENRTGSRQTLRPIISSIRELGSVLILNPHPWIAALSVLRIHSETV
jgi:hypothetical protein